MIGNSSLIDEISSRINYKENIFGGKFNSSLEEEHFTKFHTKKHFLNFLYFEVLLTIYIIGTLIHSFSFHLIIKNIHIILLVLTASFNTVFYVLFQVTANKRFQLIAYLKHFNVLVYFLLMDLALALYENDSRSTSIIRAFYFQFFFIWIQQIFIFRSSPTIPALVTYLSYIALLLWINYSVFPIIIEFNNDSQPLSINRECVKALNYTSLIENSNATASVNQSLSAVINQYVLNTTGVSLPLSDFQSCLTYLLIKNKFPSALLLKFNATNTNITKITEITANYQIKAVRSISFFLLGELLYNVFTGILLFLIVRNKNNYQRDGFAQTRKTEILLSYYEHLINSMEVKIVTFSNDMILNCNKSFNSTLDCFIGKNSQKRFGKNPSNNYPLENQVVAVNTPIEQTHSQAEEAHMVEDPGKQYPSKAKTLPMLSIPSKHSMLLEFLKSMVLREEYEAATYFTNYEDNNHNNNHNNNIKMIENHFEVSLFEIIMDILKENIGKSRVKNNSNSKVIKTSNNHLRKEEATEKQKNEINKHSSNKLQESTFTNNLKLSESRKAKDSKQVKDNGIRICEDGDPQYAFTDEIQNLGIFESRESKYFRVYLRIIFNATDKYVIELLFDDLTEIKNAERVMSESKLKQRLFSKVAHEFKTPLIVIKSLITEFNDEGCLKDRKKLSKHICSLSDYTSFLINDIIYYSNNDSIKIQQEEVNLEEIMEFCDGVSNSLVAVMGGVRKDVKITSSFDERINNYRVISDKTRLKQVLLNIISNAVKFTKFGEISLKALLIAQGRENDDKENDKDRDAPFTISNSLSLKQAINRRSTLPSTFSIAISIKDTGIGMHPENLSKLRSFEDRVITINTDSSSNAMGTGIGMNITKSILSKLEHGLNIESEFGKGSEFTIIIRDVEPLGLNNKNNNKKRSNTALDISEIKEEQTSKERTNNEINQCYPRFRSNVDSIAPSLSSNQSSNVSRAVKDEGTDYTKKLDFENEDILCFMQNTVFPTPKVKEKSKGTGKATDKCTGKAHSIELVDCRYSCEPLDFTKELNRTTNFDDIAVKSKKSNKSLNSTFKPTGKYESLVKSKLEDYNSENIVISTNHLYTSSSRVFSQDPNKLNSSKKLRSTTDMLRNSTAFSLGENISLYKSEPVSTLKVLGCSVKQQEKAILIVDDSETIRNSLCNILLQNKIVKSEYEVLQGQDGIDILNHVMIDQSKGNKLRLIITDENMEYLNGSKAISLVRELEAQNKVKRVFIISLTAFSDDETTKFIKKSGADLVYPKPLTKQQIDTIIIDIHNANDKLLKSE